MWAILSKTPQRTALAHARSATPVRGGEPGTLAGTMIVCIVALALLWPMLPDARANEDQQRARFLLNFARYTEWPTGTFESADTPFRVGLFGDGPFAIAAENTLTNKLTAGRSIVVTRIIEVEDVGRCQLLYIPASEDPRLDAIFARIQGRPVLTVGESHAFVKHHGCIQLFSHKGQAAFRVNLVASEKVGLKFSSKLLRIAKLIYLPPEAASEPTYDPVPRPAH